MDDEDYSDLSAEARQRADQIVDQRQMKDMPGLQAYHHGFMEDLDEEARLRLKEQRRNQFFVSDSSNPEVTIYL